jgi:acetoin utilization deacetylase AcuC-like enzyme
MAAPSPRAPSSSSSPARSSEANASAQSGLLGTPSKQDASSQAAAAAEGRLASLAAAGAALASEFERLSLNAAESPTGLVYDERNLLHRANYSHFECPERASTIFRVLNEAGLAQRCVRVPAREATDEELRLTHSAEHIDHIKATALDRYGPEEPDSESEDRSTAHPDCKFLDKERDTFVNQHSALAGRLAVGGLLELVDRVVTGQLRNGFAVIRPPGHHAEARAAMGFCLFNNVAVAARAAQHKHPSVRKVCIIDWDVHHGNGTQNLFYDDPSVLYISIHRYQNGTFFPRTGSPKEVGTGAGLGRNINIALPSAGLGDAEYLESFASVVVPACREFGADLTIISAGFDCAAGDPLGGMEVSSECFAHLTHMMMAEDVSRGRLVMALEGGYNTRAISAAVEQCVRVLLGQPLPKLDDAQDLAVSARQQRKMEARREAFRKALKQTLRFHRPYWTCFGAGRPLQPSDEKEDANAGDIVVVDEEQLRTEAETRPTASRVARASRGSPAGPAMAAADVAPSTQTSSPQRSHANDSTTASPRPRE